MVEKIDDWCCAKIQDAYLWLFDWTGTYVATIQFLLLSVAIGTDLVSHDRFQFWLGLFFMSVGGYVMYHRYVIQDKKNYTVFNLLASQSRSDIFRICWQYGALPVFVIGEAWNHEWFGLIKSVAWLFYFWLLCIYIRDREPKEWFTKRIFAFNGA